MMQNVNKLQYFEVSIERLVSSSMPDMNLAYIARMTIASR